MHYIAVPVFRFSILLKFVVVQNVAALLLKGQVLPLLKVSKDNHYLVNENEIPFFWPGGTAWELIHRLIREDVNLYMTDRKKGFTINQTIILAELNGLNTPNAYGHKPLTDNDPKKIN